MAIKKEIKKKLLEKIDLKHFDIKDFTGRHLNHKLHEGGFHLEATIVSDSFIGKSLIDRHRMVYAALNKLMEHKIHALSMTTLTPDEWKEK
tara:strand:+ start:200 stop:472 length:273 start_codon:yes stop_codon:yes gene_type:complete